jgi:DNA-binding CsgD family transcriptional regulator
MNAERLARLTEAQRTCLRMVFMHMSSKDIARELGISHHTVDQRLKAAIQTLGVETRVDAARLLARDEGGEAYQPLVYQSPDIADGARDGAPPAFVEHEGAMGRPGFAMREDQAGFGLAYLPPRTRMALPLPLRGTTPNDLTPWQRLAWAIAIMIGIALAFGVFVAGVEALSRLTN